METVFRTVAVYALLWVVTRVAGRRTLAQMTVFDFVLLLIIAETVDSALTGTDNSLTTVILVVVTLVMVDVVLSLVKRRSPRVARILDGTPTVLISRGTPDHEAMRRARVEMDEVLETARQTHGLSRLDQIDAAVLEVGGAISIIPKRDAPP